MIPADIPAVAGLRNDRAIKVFLKLKAVRDGVPRIRYKVKDSQTIVIEEQRQSEPVTGQNLRLFVLDGIEDVTSKTGEVTSSILPDTVSGLLDGFNVAVLAYGQNGSGKTYTMFGDDEKEGLVQGTCRKIFSEIEREEARNVEFTVSMSIIEVYCEEIRDLLALPDHRKALKLQADSKKTTLDIKGLQDVALSSLSETLSCLKQVQTSWNGNNKRISSRASVITKITIKQRNNDDEIMKVGTLQMIDLASSDKVDKDSDSLLSTEDAKKINNSMDAIDNVARSLAGSKLTVNNTGSPSRKLHIPYKESCLTQLLREVIGGNYRTTVILACSTTKEDEEETLNTLNFGANMKLVKNSVHQNKSGFNAKKIIDLMVKDFNVEHTNYHSKIQLLENEIKVLRGKQREKENSPPSMLLAENNKLKAQVDSLSQLLNSDGKKAKDDEHSKIINTLMEKCEHVIQLQMKLDNERSRVAHLDSDLQFKVSREQALEAMNLKLLNQLQENENELRQVLTSNFDLKQDIEKWQRLAATRLEKNDSLESLLSANHSGKLDDRNRRSSASSAGSFMAQIDEHPQTRKSSWFFGHSGANSRATRQVSVNSVGSSASQEPPRSKALRNGINLNVVSGDAESFNNK